MLSFAHGRASAGRGEARLLILLLAQIFGRNHYNATFGNLKTPLILLRIESNYRSSRQGDSPVDNGLGNP
jgi:hypothetical protein